MTLFSRRLVVGGLAAGLTTGGRAHAAPRPAIVTLFGDSISAGYGLNPEQGLASALKAEIERLGYPNDVRNAGLAGATSADGRARVKAAVKQDTDVCVVEFGGNDRIRSFPPSVTRECLNVIVRELKGRGVSVVLMGLAVPDDARDQSSRLFDALFGEVAKANEIGLCGDFMSDITREAGLRQPDGAHPNAAGVLIIARKLAPFVIEALTLRR